MHGGPDCATWSTLQSLNPNSTRTTEKPEGTLETAAELEGNHTAALMLYVAWECLRNGVFFGLEQPRRGRMTLLPLWAFILKLSTVREVPYEGCAWGLRPPTRKPASGDLRTQKGSLLITNNPELESLGRRCSAEPPHKH